MQKGSAQCGTMLVTVSLTHHSLLIFNLVFSRLLHLTGLMNQTKHLHRRSPVLGAALGPFTSCNGYTCSTSLLSSSSGRGKAFRWSRWEEGNVSSYRVLTTLVCVVGQKNHSLFIALLNSTLSAQHLWGALEGWTVAELIVAALTAHCIQIIQRFPPEQLYSGFHSKWFIVILWSFCPLQLPATKMEAQCKFVMR